MAILSFRDVTAARKLADELRQTKDFLERLIDSSVDAIIAADMTGSIILFNKGAEAICGYTAAEAIGKLNVSQPLPARRRAKEVMAKLRSPELRRQGRLTVDPRRRSSSQRGELRARQHDRFDRLRGQAARRPRSASSPTFATEADTRAEAVGRRDAPAESEKNAVIVALAGTAAHELNQPLTSVMGYAELLKRKIKETDFAYRPVDIIHREAERMAEIVRKIGKITRFETKSYVGTTQIVDLDKAAAHEE